MHSSPRFSTRLVITYLKINSNYFPDENSLILYLVKQPNDMVTFATHLSLSCSLARATETKLQEKFQISTHFEKYSERNSIIGKYSLRCIISWRSALFHNFSMGIKHCQKSKKCVNGFVDLM